MPRITLENLFGKTLEISDTTKSLLQHFQDHRIDWMHACGGKGRCTTCKVVVVSGMEHFRTLTSAEERYRRLGALSLNERLACQAKVAGDVTLLAPEEYHLPHLLYSDGAP